MVIGQAAHHFDRGHDVGGQHNSRKLWALIGREVASPGHREAQIFVEPLLVEIRIPMRAYHIAPGQRVADDGRRIIGGETRAQLGERKPDLFHKRLARGLGLNQFAGGAAHLVGFLSHARALGRQLRRFFPLDHRLVARALAAPARSHAFGRPRSPPRLVVLCAPIWRRWVLRGHGPRYLRFRGDFQCRAPSRS